MLSTKPIKNVKDAAHYFLGQDNYYTKDLEEAKERSAWWGKGAEILNLKGTVETKIFTDLLQGQLPSGEQIGLMREGHIKHRPGNDLTFSVPKSVSIVAMLGGDDRILTALERAVDSTLSAIEKECAQARMTKAGKTVYEDTQNLIVAKFLHDISREADPQLHVHCVVMNMTQRADGQWRALASQAASYGAKAQNPVNGFLERVRHHKLFYGAMFRSELAYELKNLGYDIISTGKQGLFEIDGIDQKTLELYSTRRQQIRDQMQARGTTSANAAAAATLATRQTKKNIDRDSLQQLWEVRAKLHHLNPFALAKSLVEKARSGNFLPPVEKNEQKEVQAALHFALTHLAEGRSVFTETSVLQKAMAYQAALPLRAKAILVAMDTLKAQGELVLVKETQEGNYLTTRKILADEKTFLVAAEKKLSHPMIKPAIVSNFLLREQGLDRSQKAAIKNTFASPQRLVLIEGAAGTGKTHLLKPLADLALVAGYQPVVLVPTRLEKLALENATQPHGLKEWILHCWRHTEYASVNEFLYASANMSPALLAKPKILLIDKSERLSAAQMANLVKFADEHHSRLVLLGDRKGLETGAAGAPFAQLINAGAACSVLSQGRARVFQAAINDTLAANISSAFAKVAERVIAIEDNVQRINAMAKHYAHLPTDDTRILMPAHKLCQEMNVAVREQLQQADKLAASGQNFWVLLPKPLTQAEATQMKSYKVGDYLRFNENSSGLRKGQYARIGEVRDKMLMLETAHHKRIAWKPGAGKTEVFEACLRNIALGEQLHWRRNDRRYSLSSGEFLKVIAMKGEKIQLQKASGQKLWIDAREERGRHFDYGYAITPWQVSQRIGHVIAYQNSLSRQTHQKQFYRTLAQAEKNVWIYTESQEKLSARLRACGGEKITAIETLLAKPVVLHGIEKILTDAIYAQQAKNAWQQTPEGMAREAVNYALAHFAERDAAFEAKGLLTCALNRALGETNPALIEKAIAEAEKNGQLIPGLYSMDGMRWTTQEAIALEKEIIALSQQDVGKLSPIIADIKTVKAYLQSTAVKEEHRVAIEAICTHRDRLLMVQGHAGTGKTTMLKYLQAILSLEKTEHSYGLICLAPTHVAVNELKQRGLTAQTLESFLHQNPAGACDWQNQRVIAVDEASMISNRRFRDLCQIAQQNQARLLIIGDDRQYPAIEAGKPAAILKKIGLPTVSLTDIERQKNPVILKAVEETYAKAFRQAFTTLKNHIEVIPQTGKRLEKIATDYLAKTPAERAKTLIVTLGNEERRQQNEIIRTALKEQGELKGQVFATEILVSEDMTAIEKTRAANYAIGHKIRFSQGLAELKIARGEYLTVTRCDHRLNVLSLKNGRGEEITWRVPSKPPAVEVYAVEAREMQAGDLIRWTRTDKERGLFSPELARVVAVGEESVELRKVQFHASGMQEAAETLHIQPKVTPYQHWDYAWAMTGYSAQSKSIDSVFVNAESFRKNLASQPSWLVAITRAVNHLKIYTDDKEKFLTAVEKNSGEKTSALEVLGELPALKSSKKTFAESAPPISPQSDHRKKPREREKNPVSMVKKPLLDAKTVSEALHAQTETIVQNLLGQPKFQDGKTYRYGSKSGSLVITLQGEKRGMWYDFELNKGGNLLALIAHQQGWNMQDRRVFPQILEKAQQLLGGGQLLEKRIPAVSSLKPQINKEEKNTLAYARKLARQSVALKNTLAERYLREHRGLTLDKWPSSLRFHPGIYSKINGEAILPALLAVAQDEKGRVMAVQAVYLDAHTGAKRKDLAVSKQTWGKVQGTPVSLVSANTEKESVSYIAEGIETGLSVYAAMKTATQKPDVKITLGKNNFAHLAAETLNKNTVFCLDNDGKPVAPEVLKTLAERLQKTGKNVWFAMPEGSQRQDYNDVWQEKGAMAVKESLENARLYDAENPFGNAASTTLRTVLSPLALEKLQHREAIRDAAVMAHTLGEKSTFAPEKIFDSVTPSKSPQQTRQEKEIEF